MQNKIRKYFGVFPILNGIILAILFISTFFLMLEGSKNPQAILQHIWLLWVCFFSLAALIMQLTAASIYLNKRILSPIHKMSESAKAINGKQADYSNKGSTSDDVNEIASAFESMVSRLEEKQKILQLQTTELSDKNWELQEANAELEASYGQLEAIIEQLNEAEQKYHSLVRNIPEIVCVIDNSGVITFINHVCTEILGYEKSDLIGKSILNIIDSNVDADILNSLRLIIHKKSSVSLELPLLAKDGLSVLTEVKLTNYTVNGESIGMQAIARDITQKKRMEKELRQSNKELAILNSVSKSLTSTLDMNDLSRLIVHEVTDTLNFTACILLLRDSSNMCLDIKQFGGKFFADVNEALIYKEAQDLHLCLAGTSFDSIESLTIKNIDDNCLIGTINQNKPDMEKVYELLLVPINLKSKNLGTLIIGSVSSIKPNDASLISSIANNAAVAIDNALLYETTRKYFFRTIDALIAAVEAKDNYTEGHSQRVSEYAVKIAEKLNLPKGVIEDIKIAGILHDIGKIGISDTILLKPDRLTEQEYEIIKQHPVISNKILYPVGFSERTLMAIASHHERYDGTGYPHGLSGRDISLEAQIIAVADAYDAMTSNRSYRHAMDSTRALKELVENKFTQFDPLIVDTMIEIITDSEKLHQVV